MITFQRFPHVKTLPSRPLSSMCLVSAWFYQIPECTVLSESLLEATSYSIYFSEAVKDYIQEAKVHMSQICQDMEDGLSLPSHYVNRHVSQKEILRSGKNTNKCLDKELVIMGETDRQKSLISQNQVRKWSSSSSGCFNADADLTLTSIFCLLSLRSLIAQMATNTNITFFYLAMRVWEKPP